MKTSTIPTCDRRQQTVEVISNALPKRGRPGKKSINTTGLYKPLAILFVV
ncbi:MAG: hypothetical protein ABI165_11195 [Bryobacteraceae bacterium]